MTADGRIVWVSGISCPALPPGPPGLAEAAPTMAGLVGGGSWGGTPSLVSACAAGTVSPGGTSFAGFLVGSCSGMELLPEGANWPAEAWPVRPVSGGPGARRPWALRETGPGAGLIRWVGVGGASLLISVGRRRADPLASMAVLAPGWAALASRASVSVRVGGTVRAVPSSPLRTMTSTRGGVPWAADLRASSWGFAQASPRPSVTIPMDHTRPLGGASPRVLVRARG